MRILVGHQLDPQGDETGIHMIITSSVLERFVLGSFITLVRIVELVPRSSFDFCWVIAR
jgi:hypothetical protein